MRETGQYQGPHKFRGGFGALVNNFDNGFLKKDQCHADIYEQDGKLQVEMELPGVQKGDIDVKIEGNVLQVSGEVKQKEQVREDNYLMKERREGSFQYGFPLPDQVDVTHHENITAHFKNGVLIVSLPLKEDLDDSGNPIDVQIH